MSSTDGAAADPEAGEETLAPAEVAAARFFDEALASLGARLRQAGVALADVAPRRQAETYYQSVPAFARADFEIKSGGDPETLRLALLEQWKNEPALRSLAEGLAALSSDVGADLEQSAEVSPFLYVMF